MVSEEFLANELFRDVSSCPACGSLEFGLVGQRNTIHPKSTSTFRVMRCCGCGHWFTTPCPTQAYLSSLYSQGSLSVLGVGWEQCVKQSVQPSSQSASLYVENTILNHARSLGIGNFLEIGPGAGRVISVFSGAGWNCWAVEPGNWAREKINHYSDISELPSGIHFKVIVANDVLEHLIDPYSFFSLLWEKLEPGGRMYFCCPNVDSMRARVGGVTWRMVRPIGHLHYFSKQSIYRLFRNMNFNIKVMARYDLLGERYLRDELSYLRSCVTSGQFKDAISSCRRVLGCSSLIELMGQGDQWRVIVERVN